MARKSKTEADEITKIIEDALSVLMEHCDAAQILVSFQSNGGGTGTCFNGRGNWYARMGMATDFLSRNAAENVGIAVAGFNNEEG